MERPNMLELFRTDDGELHQADLFLDGTVAVRLVVEKLIPKKGRTAKWDWMVWAAPGPWREPEFGWHGTASSLDSAKMEALDAAVTLIADMATDDVADLSAAANATPHRWATGSPEAVH
jgi:hypothetical protein